MGSSYRWLSHRYYTRHQHSLSSHALGAELIKFVMSFPWTGPAGLAILCDPVRACFDWSRGKSLQHSVRNCTKGSSTPYATILAIATPIFAALLIVLLSAALDLVLFKKPLLDLLSQEVRVDSLWFDPRTISGHVGLLGSALFLALFQPHRGWFRKHQSVFAL